MVNTPSARGQASPGETTSQPESCPPDCDLPENSKENLDARLDHAIEETFPTSDPISVTVTKQATAEVPRETASTAVEGQDRAKQDQAEQETAEDLLDQVKEALQDVAQTTSEAAHEAYRSGQNYVRQLRDRYPEAERSYHEGRQLVRQRIAQNPWLVPLVAGAVGYALAWMIHGKRLNRDRRVPDYARTWRGYASYRDNQHG